MIFTAHRINSIKELKKIPSKYGIEIDLRDKLDRIIISHNPFDKGQNLEKFLDFFNHKFIILNIKSEGIEEKVIKILKQKKINNFFFLDTSFPFIIKYSKYLTNKFAIRVSDYESYKTVLKLKKKFKWIWLDCFEKFDISINVLKKIKKKGYKICLVSPNLHNRKISKNDLIFFKNLKKNGIKVDMVCDKIRNISIISKSILT